MTINNQDHTGHFVLAEGAVWKITNRLQNCLTENTEYECQRIDKRTGTLQKKVIPKRHKDLVGVYKTRERAEIARLNIRITELEKRFDSFIGVINEVRETYSLL